MTGRKLPYRLAWLFWHSSWITPFSHWLIRSFTHLQKWVNWSQSWQIEQYGKHYFLTSSIYVEELKSLSCCYYALDDQPGLVFVYPGIQPNFIKTNFRLDPGVWSASIRNQLQTAPLGIRVADAYTSADAKWITSLSGSLKLKRVPKTHQAVSSTQWLHKLYSLKTSGFLVIGSLYDVGLRSLIKQHPQCWMVAACDDSYFYWPVGPIPLATVIQFNSWQEAASKYGWHVLDMRSDTVTLGPLLSLALALKETATPAEIRQAALKLKFKGVLSGRDPRWLGYLSELYSNTPRLVLSSAPEVEVYALSQGFTRRNWYLYGSTVYTSLSTLPEQVPSSYLVDVLKQYHQGLRDFYLNETYLFIAPLLCVKIYKSLAFSNYIYALLCRRIQGYHCLYRHSIYQELRCQYDCELPHWVAQHYCQLQVLHQITKIPSIKLNGIFKTGLYDGITSMMKEV